MWRKLDGKLVKVNDLEVYVLCGARTSAVARRFLDTFAEKRVPVAEDFPFPEFANEPEYTFLDPNEVITLLESRRHDSYAIYWNVESGLGGEQVMLFFTEDGGMIAGIGGPTDSWEATLLAISTVVGGKYGYVTSGSCPPATSKEFKAICRQSTLASLVNGELQLPR